MGVIREITNPRVPSVIEERSFRATINTPRDGAYNIEVQRECLTRDAEGEIISVEVLDGVVRMAAAIIGEAVEVRLGDHTHFVPARLIMAALPVFFDRWAQEDADARAAA
jgi:hypothetical protein